MFVQHWTEEPCCNIVWPCVWWNLYSQLKPWTNNLWYFWNYWQKLRIPKHTNVRLIVNLLFKMYNEVTYFFKDQNNASWDANIQRWKETLRGTQYKIKAENEKQINSNLLKMPLAQIQLLVQGTPNHSVTIGATTDKHLL